MAESGHDPMAIPTLDPAPRVFLAVAPYYRGIAENLVRGAGTVLGRAGAEAEVAEVPGALELPGAVALAIRSGRFDAYVALGCVIRGETTHYDTVCDESARGLMDLSVREGAAIGNGILTVETMEQAEDRADPARQDKGGGAALAALHMGALARRLAPRAALPMDGPEETIRLAGSPDAGRETA